MDAARVWRDDRIAELAEEATATSEVAALIARANFKNAEDASATDFNRWGLTQRRNELAKTIPPEGAKIYVKLLRKSRVPDWVRAIMSERDMTLLAGKVE